MNVPTRIKDRSVSDIDRQIEGINDELQPLLRKLDALKRKKRELESKEFIKVNKITRDDVEMSRGKDKDKFYFGNVWSFAERLKKNSAKRFAEWNDVIYFQSDLKAGRMPRDMPATVDEL